MEEDNVKEKETEKNSKCDSYEEKLNDKLIKEIEEISNKELNEKNLDLLGQLVDIKKDLENIEYWNCKKEVMKMRYNDLEENYSDGYGNYGRRGVPGTGRRRRYRGQDEGEEMLEEIRESYSAYSDSMGAYNMGNYGAGKDGMKALEDTMELFTEFTQKMIQEADSPEEKQIVKKYLRRISQMG